jgi:hypothetical protein
MGDTKKEPFGKINYTQNPSEAKTQAAPTPPNGTKTMVSLVMDAVVKEFHHKIITFYNSIISS